MQADDRTERNGIAARDLEVPKSHGVSGFAMQNLRVKGWQ